MPFAKKEKKLYNLDFLKEHSFDDEELMIEMIQTFIKKAPEELDYLDKAVKSKNHKQITMIAHSLHNMLVTMQIKKALNIINPIEKDAWSEYKIEDLHLKVKSLIQIVTIAIGQLKEEIVNLSENLVYNYNNNQT